MKLETYIRVMNLSRDDMGRALELRRAGVQGIAVHHDRLALKWQKARRQHEKFKTRAFLMVAYERIELKVAYGELNKAVIVLQNIFDDGEGGSYRGEINSILVGINQKYGVSDVRK